MNYKISDKLALEEFILAHYDEINAYIDQEMSKIVVPLYSSVDIREDSHKFAPVDHNLYPAGFNNLCTIDLKKASEAFRQSIMTIDPKAKTLGILPESHTKNLMYLENIVSLKTCLEAAGFSVVLFTPDQEMFGTEKDIRLTSAKGSELQIHLARFEDGLFVIDSLPATKIDVVILNHDQSNPFDLNWYEAKVPVVPSPLLGWYKRQKNRHFSIYHEILQRFGEKFSINPDLLEAHFATVAEVDFMAKEGLDKVASAIDELKSKINHPDTKIFMKASKGTYGMGISVVSSGEEVINMNRKNRNKMDVGKNHIKFTDILLQEGVETIIKYDNMPAEITIYLVGGKPIGGFMRANQEKGTLDNLNSRGMVFKKFCIQGIQQDHDDTIMEAAYSIIARLSTLASGFELSEIL